MHATLFGLEPPVQSRTSSATNGADISVTVVYFDSSAFVKLLVEEPGSVLAAQLWDGCDAAVSSKLAYPEVRAALAAGGRAGLLRPAELGRAVAAWEDFLGGDPRGRADRCPRRARW